MIPRMYRYNENNNNYVTYEFVRILVISLGKIRLDLPFTNLNKRGKSNFDMRLRKYSQNANLYTHNGVRHLQDTAHDKIGTYVWKFDKMMTYTKSSFCVRIILYCILLYE